MTERVPAAEIETLVGIERHQTDHFGRIDTWEQQVYILHSHRCWEEPRPLQECPYSIALDEGFNIAYWGAYANRPVRLAVERGELVPYWM